MVTVIIPALNEAARIRGVIELAQRSVAVNEVIVVDDGSVDDTVAIAQAAGAKVITSTLLGKGASMEDGLREASNEIVAYLDGDLTGLRRDVVDMLVAPLLAGEAEFTKARFSRSAGRVTTLTARPLLQLFFPELAHFVQPLGGIMAATRGLLRQLKFETDYGVDLALLIDAQMLGARIVEVDIGHLEHESQSLEALGAMSKQVVRALLQRAEMHGRLSAERIQEVEEVERHERADFEVISRSLKQVKRLAVFDMDGTLLRGRFVVHLARACGKEQELAKWLDNSNVGTEERGQQIANLFKDVPRETFEAVARDIELTPSAVETVVQLRKLGFTVGIVSDSYRIATEIVRRRVFADFSVGNLMHFEKGVATGEVKVSPLLEHPHGCAIHRLCKLNVVQHLIERLGIRDNQVLAVGDGLNDVCMLGGASLSVAFEPKASAVRKAAQHTVVNDLDEVVSLVRLKGWDMERSFLTTAYAR